MARRQRALVRDKKADHWLFEARRLVLRSDDGLVELMVPVEDLGDEGAMRKHYARLATIATEEQVEELREIAAGRK